jgi:hypothetical protein
MATQIVDLYKAQKTQLGTDKIGKDSGNARKTPLSTDDLQKIDTKAVSEERLKQARGGVLNSKKYSDTVVR